MRLYLRNVLWRIVRQLRFEIEFSEHRNHRERCIDSVPVQTIFLDLIPERLPVL